MGTSASRCKILWVVCKQIDTYKIDKFAKREAPPDTEVVVHVDLTDRHPFEVCAHSVHLRKPKLGKQRHQDQFSEIA